MYCLVMAVALVAIGKQGQIMMMIIKRRCHLVLML
jgi:hypothetical protein